MFDQLKPIMRNGERYIVVEGGRPEFVLMRFADYVVLTAGRSDFAAGAASERPASQRGAGEWEWASTPSGVELEEVSAHDPAIRTAGFSTPMPPADPTTIRLEDLPL